MTQAAGGIGEGSGGGNGGKGGAGDLVDGTAGLETYDNTARDSGGGGGGVGRIRINALNAQEMDGIISPTLSSGKTTIGSLKQFDLNP